MPHNATYQIGELARSADVTPRTIRFYTSEGLLPAPRLDGRVAVYTDAHLRRLRLIARLKAAFLPLHEIRERLREMTEEELETLVETSEPEVPPAAPGQGAAAAYVRRLLAEREGLSRPRPAVMFCRVPPAAAAQPRAGQPTDVSGEAWQRIELAPGIELHVRLPLTPAGRELVEVVMAHSRRPTGSE